MPINMPNEQAMHQRYMAKAIQLANNGLYTTAPNPRVGCLLVRDKEIVGEGWHVKAGEAHAEINALHQAGDNAQGATAYVTLEPCSHTGKTGPCCEALIAAGVVQVVVAMQDPNPLVAGNGIKRLREANIQVDVGVLEAEARKLNPGFIKRMEQGLPYVRVKMAMSVDGRTAMSSGESQWITGPAARQDVQRLRARSSAIVTGVDSVIMDNPSLTVRAEELGLDNAVEIVQQQPLRVVVDSALRSPAGAKMFNSGDKVLIATAVANDHHENDEHALARIGAEIQCFPAECLPAENKVDLTALLEFLANNDHNEVLVETGATLAGAFVQCGLVDELIIYMAPTLLGDQARPLFRLPGLETMTDKITLQIQDIRAVGDDWRITATTNS